MQDGYYWYLGTGSEEWPPDLDTAEWQIVEVYDTNRVTLSGSDVSYNISEARGRFVGPIEPPT